MRSINDRLQEMTEKINSGNLLESSGLGNEINFRVFDYDPEDEYVVRDYLYNYLLIRNKNIIVFDFGGGKRQGKSDNPRHGQGNCSGRNRQRLGQILPR